MSVYGAILPGAASLSRFQGELSREARQRLKWIDWYHSHSQNGRKTCRHFGISPDTFYRWLRRYNPRDLSSLEDRSRKPHHLRQRSWSVELVQEVQRLREQYPRWGKEKLARLLPQELATSVSTVGRILAYLKQRGVLKEPTRQGITQRRRPQRPHAVRKPKEYQPQAPGDLVEVDTLDIRPLPGVVLKQFTARDVVCRWDVLEVHHRATASLAAQFLESLLDRMPFPIKAIQVDGGSEFYAQFEAACQSKGIPLFVLPPKSPKLNAHVERANRTHTEEFYEVVEDLPWTVAELAPYLLEHEWVYNHIRPHQSLGYLTPHAYWQRWQAEHPPQQENGTAGEQPDIPSPPNNPSILYPTGKEVGVRHVLD
jgi:transposase InsO family protein